MKDFIEQSIERGFIYQATDLKGLQKKMNGGPITGYIGFDATAPSLHVGNLVSLMWLRLFKKTGNSPIALLGGATTLVGDPSGRNSQRPMISEDKIDAYVELIEESIKKIVGGVEIKNNSRWLHHYKIINFLEDVGTHFSLSNLLKMDSIKQRLEEGTLSFLELNYPLLQSFDFAWLADNNSCILQMGGSDQWGNITSGIELARKKKHKEQLYGLTCPLITTADGAKMGKTAKGAVWLNADMCPREDYWQFWMDTSDEDVGRFLKLFTDIPIDEIERLEVLEGAELHVAKTMLSDEATCIVHGVEP